MIRLLKWAAAIATAVGVGVSAGIVHAVWSEAAANRNDAFLLALAWLFAAFITVVGLAAIAGLFRTSRQD